MTDLAALRRTDATRLTRRVRREVVVVQVALLGDGVQRIDLLLHLEHIERRDAQDLGLAALEDRRAVNARDDLHLDVKGADLRERAAVDTDAVGQHAGAHDLLRHRLVSGTHHGRNLAAEVACIDTALDCLLDALLECVVGALTLDLVSDLVDGLEVVVGDLGNRVVRLVGVGREQGEVLDGLRGLGRELLLSLDELLEERLGGLEALSHNCLVGLRRTRLDEFPATFGCFGLDHHDRDVFVAVLVGDEATRDREVEYGVGELAVLRERNPLVADQGETDAADRAVERKAGDLRARRSGVDREGVVELVGRDREDRDDDLNLVAQAFDEGRAQRSVDETADEDRFRRGATLAAEERSGNLARCVRALFNIHREGEEVEAVARVLAGARGAQDHGVFVEVRGNGTLCLLREASGLKTNRTLAELAVIENGFGELNFWTLQGVFSFF